MLARNNEYIKEVVATIYQVSQEENIRFQCEAREDYYRQQKDMEHVMEEQGASINKLSSQNQELSSQNQELSSQNQELSSQNQKLSCKNREITSEHEKLLAWARDHGYKQEL